MPDRRACPQCGAAAEVAFDIQDFNRRIDRQTFRYFHCTGCGVWFLGDIPRDLARYYPPDYYTIARSPEELDAWSASERYKIELVKQFRAGGRLIEIGPASGSFCHLAKTSGFDVTAIEMDQRCSEFLAATLGIHVVNSANEAAAVETLPPADVIAMWHVIEHLVDPWSMLKAAAGRLRPGGVLVLAAPNPGAFQFRALGERWVHIDAPRHLWLIPPEVLSKRGRDLGLETALVTTRDKGSLGWNGFGWEYTLMNRFRSGFARRVAALAGRVTAVAAYPLEAREGQGAAYTVVLRKPAA